MTQTHVHAPGSVRSQSAALIALCRVSLLVVRLVAWFSRWLVVGLKAIANQQRIARDSNQGLKFESREKSAGWVEVGSQKRQSSCCQRQTLGFVGSCKRNDGNCAALLVVDLAKLARAFQELDVFLKSSAREMSSSELVRTANLVCPSVRDQRRPNATSLVLLVACRWSK